MQTYVASGVLDILAIIQGEEKNRSLGVNHYHKMKRIPQTTVYKFSND
jgi:hypothetical protein